MALKGHHLLLTLYRDEPASWSEAFIAGLPHLLYPWAVYGYIYLSGLFFQAHSGSVSFASDLVFWTLVLAGLVSAWRRGWPRWSATWVGYGLVMAVELLWILTTTGGSADPLVAILTGIVWITLVVIALVRTARRDWLDGLLAVLPLVPMWISVLALDVNIGNGTPVFLIDGLVMALFVALIVRRGNLLTGIGLMLAAITLVGLPVASITVYHTHVIPSITSLYGRNLLEVLVGYLSYLVVFIIAATPVWLVGLWKWGGQRIMK